MHEYCETLMLCCQELTFIKFQVSALEIPVNSTLQAHQFLKT